MDCWRKICVLGAGSYGVVHYAVRIDSALLRASAAAVKSTHISRSLTLKTEAEILSTLVGCPNVVQYFGSDISIENGFPMYNLFLEYACGGSLHDLIHSRRGKLSELEIGFYAYQLLNGIRDVHAKGWVHCDIKPANVLVYNADECGIPKLKLADFGLSLGVGEGMAYVTGPLRNRGTLLYAAPESLVCGLHTKAYDIWSLGCTVAEMMTGNHVWLYQDMKELQWQIMTEYPMIPSNVSEVARDFLYKCFIVDPQRRWTAAQLLEHPFIQKAAALCTRSTSQVMPQTDGITAARVDPFSCKLPVPEKDFINLTVV